MIAEGLDVIDTHPTHDQAISGSRDNRINAALVSFTVNSLLVIAVIFTNILKSTLRLFRVKIIHLQCFDILFQLISKSL